MIHAHSESSWTYNGEGIICNSQGDVAEILNGNNADGYLIAAAPQMMAALQMAAQYTDMKPGNLLENIKGVIQSSITKAHGFDRE